MILVRNIKTVRKVSVGNISTVKNTYIPRHDTAGFPDDVRQDGREIMEGRERKEGREMKEGREIKEGRGMTEGRAMKEGRQMTE
jgi:hypothetical protein